MATDAANVVVGKVVDFLFGAIRREIDYIRNYTKSIEELRNETQKLKDMKGRVEQRIVVAKDKGEDLVHGVQQWVEKASAEITTADDFLEEEVKAKKSCFNLRLCINLGTLHRYSKMATKKVPFVRQHQVDGNTYESCVSIPAPALGFMQLYEKKNLDGLDTQKLTLEKIVEAIKDESKQIIAIYGLGGVGKTTLAKEVALEVKNLFADVVFTTVSQNVKVEQIKKDVEDAAKRIKKGEKILIIVDDVWSKLKFDEVGIPCGVGHMNCKILLTSRSERVCVAMDAQSNICVNPLPKEETWILFKKAAGERVETDTELKPIATKVAKECGGLPLIIQAIGKALQNKSIDIWEAALDRLKNHAPLNIDPEIRRAFVCLEQSYNFLESEEAKSCFLLCSMFPEDASIPLEKLTHYMVGLGKFEHLHRIDDASGRVKIAVMNLKSSFLLLDGDDESKAKMHDVVRDVALLIGSKGQNILVEAGMGLKEWPIDRDDALKKYTTVSLMCNHIDKLPDREIYFPHLDTLLLQRNRISSTISDALIQGMREVKVLDMEYNSISSLPQSFASLTKLHMLNLGNNYLKEISLLAELKDLEILILNNTAIEEIPQQFGQLNNLRLLNLKGCVNLSHIAPGVISKLHRLEELHIEYELKEGNYNYLVELSNLKRLTRLHLRVSGVDLIPEDLQVETLKVFLIKIEPRMTMAEKDWLGLRELLRRMNHLRWDLKMESSRRSLTLRGCDLKIPMSRVLVKLIEVTHSLSLISIGNLNDIVPSLNNGVSNNLETIELSACTVSCLLDAKHRDNLSKNSFIKLHSIYLSECPKLQNIVSSNMAHVVWNIRTLEVVECESVRCIFDCEGLGGGKGEQMFLSKLESLELIDLPNLKAIWNCPDQLISLSNLVFATIAYLKLKRLFSDSIAQGLVHLKELEISGCSCLKEVIWVEDRKTVKSETEEISLSYISKVKNFPCLEQIVLDHIPKLKSVYAGHHVVEYPSLVYVRINKCESMERWGYGVHHTPKLKHVSYSSGDRQLKGPNDIDDLIRRTFRPREADVEIPE